MWVVMERAVLLGSLSDVWEPLIKRMGIYMVLFFFSAGRSTRAEYRTSEILRLLSQKHESSGSKHFV